MARLWKDFDGEPFLVNPQLFIVNKRRRKARKRRSKMARRLPPRNKKGRFVKRGSVTRRRHAFKARIKYRGRARRVRVVRHPALVNPRRRRRYRRNDPGRRRYAYVMNRRRHRRNPNILSKVGLSMPMLKTVGFTLVGTIGTPYVEGFVRGYLPAGITSNQFGNYAVKIGSAWVVSFGVGAIAGREASRAALIGGLAYTAVAVLRDFNLLPAAGTAAGMGVQPLLGRAAAIPRMGAYNTPITATPSGRLDPASRF